jgi:hypothetical protein
MHSSFSAGAFEQQSAHDSVLTSVNSASYCMNSLTAARVGGNTLSENPTYIGVVVVSTYR